MFDFRVVPDNGDPYEVTAGARDVLVLEKTTKGVVFADLTERMQMVPLYKLAWIASRRLGLFTGTQAEFEAGCELIFTESEEPDPTRPAP
ncbi:hypothetical protein ACIBF5_09500 [Micromonospora sp. NPDC050417]|uniref:hypothetical protein n=1 Tax=Micromonospora sp. NPDC050417 TaxID=3364280 RepID=UPI0037A83540